MGNLLSFLIDNIPKQEKQEKHIQAYALKIKNCASMLELGMSQEEILNFEELFNLISAENVTNNGTSYCEQVYRSQNGIKLIFRDGLLSQGAWKKHLLKDNPEKHEIMQELDQDMIGRTPYDAFGKYPGSFHVITILKLYQGG